jgi:O-antigen ligase
MKSAALVNHSSDLAPIKWILFGLIAITLYFQTTLADPINSPKSWILVIVAAWLLGYVVSFRKMILLVRPVKNITYLVLVFLFFLALSTVYTDFIYVGVFGETQRRNGFISYLSLSIILLATSVFIRITTIKKLFFVTYFIGSVLVIYALMQTTGNDFVKWNNPYNAVIVTLGNPNFAAAVMAIIGVITFATVFISDFSNINRIFAAMLALALLFVIYRSNAKQGLLAMGLGVGVFLIILLWSRSKKLGFSALLAGIFVFILSVLGMLQSGPFEKYLYKPSVSIRGFYWRAGIEMLNNNPLLGIGTDRYGANFKQYREVNYPLNYGFEITSSNAHNTFIQFFATGGIFVGIAYLILNGYILRRAYIGLKNLAGSQKLLLAGVFSAWIAFHAQSLVSIDNIGISIWGWILGGSILGISVSADPILDHKHNYFVRKPSSINLSRVLISGFTTLLSLILVSILYQGETNAFRATATVNSQDVESRAFYKNLQLNVIHTALIDPTYKLFSAVNLYSSGFTNEGIGELKKITLADPRNLDALQYLAQIYEAENKLSDAIHYREKIVDLDPWNAKNYLALGINYKLIGNLDKSKLMLDKILSFAGTNQIADLAKKELVLES